MSKCRGFNNKKAKGYGNGYDTNVKCVNMKCVKMYNFNVFTF